MGVRCPCPTVYNDIMTPSVGPSVGGVRVIGWKNERFRYFLLADTFLRRNFLFLRLFIVRVLKSIQCSISFKSCFHGEYKTDDAFLVADMQLFKRLCLSVRPSVRRSVMIESKSGKTRISTPAHLSATCGRVSGLVLISESANAKI